MNMFVTSELPKVLHVLCATPKNEQICLPFGPPTVRTPQRSTATPNME